MKKSTIMLALAFVIGGYVYIEIDLIYGLVVAGAMASVGWYWKTISESGEDIPEADEEDDDELALDMDDNGDEEDDTNDEELTLEDI